MSFLMETLDYWIGEVGDLDKNCMELWTAAMTKRISVLDYIKISLSPDFVGNPLSRNSKFLFPSQGLNAKSGT